MKIVSCQNRNRYDLKSGNIVCAVAKRSADSSSDEDPTLTFPRNFAPLPLSRRSCGTFDPPAPAEAPSNCQDPAHTTAGWHTSRSAPHLLESGLKACAAQPNELQQRDQCRPVTIYPASLSSLPGSSRRSLLRRVILSPARKHNATRNCTADPSTLVGPAV